MIAYMKQHYATLLLALFTLFAGNAAAQQSSELKKEINNIKKNSQYIYHESTLPDKSEALNSAMEALQGQMNSWAEKNGNAIANNVESVAKKIELPRGNMYRAFVYVHKDNIIEGAGSNCAATATPKVPAAETAVQKAPATITVNSKKEAEKPTLPKAIERILPLTDYDALAACIKELKAEGVIKKFGRYTDETPNIETYALVVYDIDGNIEAILSPGAQRTNYKTGKPDSLDNYRGGNKKRGALIIKL